jgi:hypothetical protein
MTWHIVMQVIVMQKRAMATKTVEFQGYGRDLRHFLIWVMAAMKGCKDNLKERSLFLVCKWNQNSIFVDLVQIVVEGM